MKSFYYADMVIAPIWAIALIEFNLRAFGFQDKLVLTVAGGVLFWTFLEYWIHRVLHEARSVGHFRHHAFPLEENGPSTFQTILILLAAYVSFQLIGGFWFASAFHAGLLVGYTAYLFVHTSIHHLRIFERAKIRIRHENHHKGIGREYFGVTTTLWDWLFGIIP